MNLLKLRTTNSSKSAAFKRAVDLLLNTMHVSVRGFQKSYFREGKKCHLRGEENHPFQKSICLTVAQNSHQFKKI